MAAGESTALEAARRTLTADEQARLAAIAIRLARSFDGAESRHRLAEALIELEPLGYLLLTDRRWPGMRDANVDFVLVGPGGVFVVDTEHWEDAAIDGGVLRRGQTDVSDEIAKTADLVYRTQEHLAELGLPAGEVRGMTVLSSHPDVSGSLYGVSVLGEAAAVRAIARQPHRLSPAQVTAVRRELAELFPPMTTGPVGLVDPAVIDASLRVPVRPSAPPPTRPAGAPPGTLDHPGRQESGSLSPQDVLDALLAGVLAEPVEPWMTFLHPAQARIVRRSFSGPSRVRGSAGTGKTVVALHRAAHLAQSTGGKVLFTTSAHTLPRVLEGMLERLAPEAAGRVEFVSVHAFASHLLRDRGHHPNVDAKQARAIFSTLWADHEDGPLGRAEADPRYWRDEIAWVIKGRGLTEFEQYADLARIGRRRPLGLELRREVWRLYCAYEAELSRRGIDDVEDLILDAEASLEVLPSSEYTAVIVDEAQDLTCAMIRMLHSLVGDRPDGLHLIDDGQQSVYPGGYTLAEAGVRVGGRAAVLTTNFRNTAEILDFASRLVEGDEVTDIEGVITAQIAEIRPAVHRHGPAPVAQVFPDRVEHDRSFVDHVRELVAADSGVGLGDIGVLALSRWHAREATITLEQAGIPTIDLEQYDGRPVDAVKVGTIKRSKGLEFKEVLVVRAPGELLRPGETAEPDPDGADDALAERREHQRRELYVALTRARDGVWVGVA